MPAAAELAGDGETVPLAVDLAENWKFNFYSTECSLLTAQTAIWTEKRRSTITNLTERDDDVSSSELGLTNKDLSKVEALSLDDSLHASGSTDGVVVHAGNTGSDGLDSTFAQPSALEEAVSPSLSEQDLLEKSEDQSTLELEHDQSVVTHYDDSSLEEITQNGKKWMSEEVMVAFEKYITRRDDLKEYDYQFDELLHQCFNVENYYKIFHHFNFTVKMKAPCSTDWTSVLYFAEVKELLGHKIYFCSPLEPNEDGNCYACKNQGMEDLKHPIVGVFDRGFPTQVFPYTYSSGSEDEAWL
uniref:DUF3615 domain-containing protein n=1 Tax=Oryza punctata TaxID=4537 RepID=A0A0E0MHP6_ORYPU